MLLSSFPTSPLYPVVRRPTCLSNSKPLSRTTIVLVDGLSDTYQGDLIESATFKIDFFNYLRYQSRLYNSDVYYFVLIG